MTDLSCETLTLSSRLKARTAPVHERMHVLMETLDPFASRERYARFMQAQLAFQKAVEARSNTPAVRAIVPDADARSRIAQTQEDLNDLRDAGPSHDASDAFAQAAASPPGGVYAGLGWLYVSEGSTLGAAFLFKTAQAQLGLSESFGARSLAAAPAGRMTAWRGFTHALDSASLTEAQQEDVVAGAMAAFDCFRCHLEHAFAQPLSQSSDQRASGP